LTFSFTEFDDPFRRPIFAGLMPKAILGMLPILPEAKKPPSDKTYRDLALV
jgi:hypothetical protein